MWWIQLAKLIWWVWGKQNMKYIKEHYMVERRYEIMIEKLR
ncbi:MAG: hypothetical protein RR737_08805 [Lachnospiraceae bacterium]